MDKNNYLQKLKEFENKINVKFNNIGLLKQAFTHSSYANENDLCSNERLEFLGDAVLEIVVSDFLYQIYPLKDEGYLTKKRAKNVCESALCKVAKELDLGAILLLGRGEESSAGRKKCSTLSDAFEALLGAIYLDQGLATIFEILEKYLVDEIVNDSLIFEDYKSSLQEFVQADKKRSITYKLIKNEGPAHDRTFTISVYMDNIKMGIGVGKTKKEAEQNAAKEALNKLA